MVEHISQLDSIIFNGWFYSYSPSFSKTKIPFNLSTEEKAKASSVLNNIGWINQCFNKIKSLNTLRNSACHGGPFIGTGKTATLPDKYKKYIDDLVSPDSVLGLTKDMIKF